MFQKKLNKTILVIFVQLTSCYNKINSIHLERSMSYC